MCILYVVLNSGHMVPMDQPAVSLDMITRFLSGKLLGSPSRLVGVSRPPDALACTAVSTEVVQRGSGGKGGLRGGGKTRNKGKQMSD